jgi:membrane-associated phospholipid phosphatase
MPRRPPPLPPTPSAARVAGAAAAWNRHPPCCDTSAGSGRHSPDTNEVKLETMTKTTPEQEREIDGPSRTSGESFLAHPAPALWTAGGMLAPVVLIAILVPAGPLDLDRSWSDAMHRLETPLLTDLALVFNWLGRGLGRAIALTLVGLLLLRRRRWLALVAFAVAVAVAVAESLAPLISALLKVLVERARPPDGLVHPVGVSFPSGHATYAGATCVALVLLFTTPGTCRRWWWALVSLGVVGMAWSRTYRPCKSTGSPMSLPALFSAAASRSSCSPSHGGAYVRLPGSACTPRVCAAPLDDRR